MSTPVSTGFIPPPPRHFLGPPPFSVPVASKDGSQPNVLHPVGFPIPPMPYNMPPPPMAVSSGLQTSALLNYHLPQFSDFNLSSVYAADLLEKLKADGTFDKLRRDCLADIDTKPAFQNLLARVEKTTSEWLEAHAWPPASTKAQLRESLREELLGKPGKSSPLGDGIERTLDQTLSSQALIRVVGPVMETAVAEFLCLSFTSDNKQQERHEYFSEFLNKLASSPLKSKTEERKYPPSPNKFDGEHLRTASRGSHSPRARHDSRSSSRNKDRSRSPLYRERSRSPQYRDRSRSPLPHRDRSKSPLSYSPQHHESRSSSRNRHHRHYGHHHNRHQHHHYNRQKNNFSSRPNYSKVRRPSPSPHSGKPRSGQRHRYQNDHHSHNHPRFYRKHHHR